VPRCILCVHLWGVGRVVVGCFVFILEVLPAGPSDTILDGLIYNPLPLNTFRHVADLPRYRQ
jgi:hypothetical protein